MPRREEKREKTPREKKEGKRQERERRGVGGEGKEDQYKQRGRGGWWRRVGAGGRVVEENPLGKRKEKRAPWVSRGGLGRGGGGMRLKNLLVLYLHQC